MSLRNLRLLHAVGANPPPASLALSTLPAKVVWGVGPATGANRKGSCAESGHRTREHTGLAAGWQRTLHGGLGMFFLTRSNNLPLNILG